MFGLFLSPFPIFIILLLQTYVNAILIDIGLNNIVSGGQVSNTPIPTHYYLTEDTEVNADACDCGSNSECKPNVNGVCICPKGILGLNCKTVHKCPLNCQNDGTCIQPLKPKCICRIGFFGHTCDQKLKCVSETTTTGKGVFHWEETDFGNSIFKPCPFAKSDIKAQVSRVCALLANGTAQWTAVDDSHCPEKLQINGDLRNKINVNPSYWGSPDVEKSIETLHVLNNMPWLTKPLYKEKASDYMKSLNTLIEISDPIMYNLQEYELQSNINYESAIDNNYENQNEKIKRSVDSLLSTVVLSSGEEFVSHMNSIAVKVTEVSLNKRENEIKFNSKFRGDLAITVPVQALDMAVKQTHLSRIRVQMVAYDNQKLFKSYSDYKKSNGMPVIAAKVGNVKITELKTPIVAVFQCIDCNQTSYSLAKCVYWDESQQNWSTVGVITKTNGFNNEIICHSSHLTAFSVLFDFTPYQTEDVILLSIITTIGCYLSIIGLTLTIITYSLFRCLNRDNSGKILLNLCFSLLLLNISFIIGSQKVIIESNIVCSLTAYAVHYFVLTSLSWMCAEAILIYQLLIYVFATLETRYMLKRIVIAWGIPFIWVAITVLSKPSAYNNYNNFCMISPKQSEVYYISYLMPSSVLILVNVSVFAAAIKVLFAPRLASPSKGSGTVSISQIWGALTLIVLLGVTWILGALAIGEMKLLFQYLFCITNSIQGFLIFVFRCIRYPEARKAWIQLLMTGKIKKYRGQSQTSFGSKSTNRLSTSDRKPNETDSSFSVANNFESMDKSMKPFLTGHETDAKQTTYSSLSVSFDHQINT